LLLNKVIYNISDINYKFKSPAVMNE